jgi:EAL domain-containing protein (putative c-di-GMP-specific phosphodiesterase class I)
MMVTALNIHKIISNESIHIEYQPIMSTHHKGFLALEALSRGCDGQQIISPITLFNEAELEGLTWELDLLCVRKSIEGFSRLFQHDSSLILFVNISANVVHKYLTNTILLDIVTSHHIPSSNVVLEINELHNDSIDLMIHFTEKHRAQGFLIAIDDIGAGSSNLDRIPSLKPNVMKIDKELVKDIHKSFYKEQVVNTIMQLATNIGASVVIEGIETIEDLIKVSAQGAQLIQGYFLSKPMNFQPYDIPLLKSKINHILEVLYSASKKQKELIAAQNKEILRICNRLIATLRMASITDFENIINNFLGRESTIESIYILNSHGYLITDTLLNSHVDTTNSNSLYSPCQKGDSVQLEPYYTQVVYGGYDFWITPEYLSMATGNKSCTLSRRFLSNKNDTYIICLDFYKNKVTVTEQILLQLKRGSL